MVREVQVRLSGLPRPGISGRSAGEITLPIPQTGLMALVERHRDRRRTAPFLNSIEGRHLFTRSAVKITSSRYIGHLVVLWIDQNDLIVFKKKVALDL
jgi:hypothetical protein